MLKFVYTVGHFCKRLLHKHETLPFTRVNVEALNATKPVFGISLVASLDKILIKKRITKVLISLRGCVDWSAPLIVLKSRIQDFSC